MPSWRRPASLLLGVLCLASDFLVTPLLAMQNGPPRILHSALFLGMLGCVLAQGNLLAAWLAWGDWPFALRLRRHWMVASILYLVWVAGLATCGVPQFPQLVSFAALSVPLISLAAQLPFWIVRHLFGWRLTTSPPPTADPPVPLSIRDLLWATALVAVTLTLARAAPSADDKEIGGLWVVMLGVASTVSTIALLPAAPILLRPGSFQRGVLFGLTYAGAWVSLLWLIVLVILLQGRVIPPPAAIVIGASSLILSYAGTVILTAWVARNCGYWLAWGRPHRDDRIKPNHRKSNTKPNAGFAASVFQHHPKHRKR